MPRRRWIFAPLLLLALSCAASPVAVEAKAAGGVAIALEQIKLDAGLAIIRDTPTKAAADAKLDTLRAAWAPVQAAEDAYAHALGDATSTPVQAAEASLLVRAAYCALRATHVYALPDYPVPALLCPATASAAGADAGVLDAGTEAGHGR